MNKIKSIIRYVMSVSPVRENKIMRRAGGYVHTHNIKNSLLIFMIFGMNLGMVIGKASSDIIDDFICIILGALGDNTISIIKGLSYFTGVIGVIGSISVIVFFINVIVKIIEKVIENAIRSVVISIVTGFIIINATAGVIGGIIGDVIEDVNEQLFNIGLIYMMVLVICMVFRYDKWRLGYLGELAVADELCKVGCQQWQIFHGLKSDGGVINHIIVCKKGVFCVSTQTHKRDPKIKGEIRVEKNKICIYEDNKFKMKLGDNLIGQVQNNANGLYDEINKEYCKLKKCCKLKEGEHDEINKKYCEFKGEEHDEINKKYCKLKGEKHDEINKKYCALKEEKHSHLHAMCCEIKKGRHDEINKKYCEREKGEHDEINKKYCALQKRKFLVSIITFPGWCVKEEGCNPKIATSSSDDPKGVHNEIVVCNPKKISKEIKDREYILCDCDVNKICKFLEKATLINVFDAR